MKRLALITLLALAPFALPACRSGSRGITSPTTTFEVSGSLVAIDLAPLAYDGPGTLDVRTFAGTERLLLAVDRATQNLPDLMSVATRLRPGDRVVARVRRGNGDALFIESLRALR